MESSKASSRKIIIKKNKKIKKKEFLNPTRKIPETLNDIIVEEIIIRL